MAPRRCGALLCLALLVHGAALRAEPARRLVSLNPSITAILLALGGGDSLVGVDDYSSRQQPAVAHLPTVGGLFNPSLESVVALEPDVVLLVPSAQQRALRARLEALDVEVRELPNIELEQLIASIESLGALVGRSAAASARVAEIRRTWQEVTRASARRPRLRAVLVLQRDPLYVVGSGSFLDEMLRAAGTDNVAAQFPDPYPRAAVEWLIAAAPQVILDASEGGSEALSFWSRWPSLPAVASRRVIEVPATLVTLPGPYPDRALRLIADSIHASDPDAAP